MRWSISILSTMDVDIARWRLSNQRLTAPHAGSAAEVVNGLLAVQAENLSQSAWAVAHAPTHRIPTTWPA